MNINHAYIFAAAPTGAQVLVGQATIDDALGSFRYDSSWLEAPWAYPLDPVNLPLTQRHYRTQNSHRVFGVLQDAGPDEWGTRIMLLNHTHAPENELARLIRTSGTGVGSVRFSLSRSRAKTPAPLPSVNLLESLSNAIERVSARQQLTAQELALIEPGSSMGGARPKVSVLVDNQAWLLKFARDNDLVDMARLEYVAMRFAKEQLDINTPPVQLFSWGDTRRAFGIKRFDRCEPIHFVSANSLFHQDRTKLIKDSRRNPYSYLNLAKILRQHATDYRQDCRELYKRMLANIAMGNTDDHARNHALIYRLGSASWHLSPAYDILPTVGSSTLKQSLGVGLEGAESSFENALSCCAHFNLKLNEAKQMVLHTQTVFKQWPNYCRNLGLAELDVELVRQRCIVR